MPGMSFSDEFDTTLVDFGSDSYQYRHCRRHGAATEGALVVDVDAFLWLLLGEELDVAALPLPPRVPGFAAPTVRPGRPS